MSLLSDLTTQATQTIDACGQPCPMPLLKLKQSLRNIDAGAHILLLASDPHSQQDISRFCTIAGHHLRQAGQIEQQFYFLIQKTAQS